MWSSLIFFRHKGTKAQRNAKGFLRAPLRLCAFVAKSPKVFINKIFYVNFMGPYSSYDKRPMSKFYLILIAFAFFTGCKSASKSYSKGDYADAIELGLKKLQKDPYDGETLEIVKNSYTYAVNSHEDQIRILSNSKTDTRYAGIFQHYIQLQDLYNTIQSYPQVARQISPRDYSEFVETYREKAASVHIDRAENYMDEGTKLGYKNAYYELNNALRFVNNYELKEKGIRLMMQPLPRWF